MKDNVRLGPDRHCCACMCACVRACVRTCARVCPALLQPHLPVFPCTMEPSARGSTFVCILALGMCVAAAAGLGAALAAELAEPGWRGRELEAESQGGQELSNKGRLRMNTQLCWSHCLWAKS